MNNDPLNWWHINEKRYSVLAVMAKYYLSIPATSSPSERVFSKAGSIENEKRN